MERYGLLPDRVHGIRIAGNAIKLLAEMRRMWKADMRSEEQVGNLANANGQRKVSDNRKESRWFFCAGRVDFWNCTLRSLRCGMQLV